MDDTEHRLDRLERRVDDLAIRVRQVERSPLRRLATRRGVRDIVQWVTYNPVATTLIVITFLAVITILD